MRVYLDENVNPKIARFLVDHEFSTPTQTGWAGIVNGRLLALLETTHDALLTHDRNLSFQQNLTGRNLSIIVIVMQGRRLADYEEIAPLVQSALDATLPGQYREVLSKR